VTWPEFTLPLLARFEAGHSYVSALALRRRRYIPKPRVAAQPRTLGCDPLATLTPKVLYTSRRQWPRVLYNAFGVIFLGREPRVRGCAATLGYGVQPLRGKDLEKCVTSKPARKPLFSPYFGIFQA